MNNALIIVDVQYDFLPGGALSVLSGHEIIFPITKLVKNTDYNLVLASQDWHPKNHMSFVQNGGIWPEHCVANTKGAEINVMIADIHPTIIYKGYNPDVEAYSAFDGYVYSHNSPTLDDYLLSNYITDVDVVGLALDYCVVDTALSAKEHGFNTRVFLDLTRPVKYLTGVNAIESLIAHGVELEVSRYS